MGLLSLNLDLPPMSAVVADRRKAQTIARRRAQALALKRYYDAARTDRLNADWTTTPTSGNHELRQGLRSMRARARDMARNDPYIKKFLGVVVKNVVGPKGVTLQARAQTAAASSASIFDDELNRTVERKFAEWAHMEHASASGKMSWLDMQRFFMRTLARDGEVLIRLIAAPNQFGFALKFIDVNWLDEWYNDLLPNGNRVLMGVEVDAYDRPVAYYLTPPYYDYHPAAYRPEQRQRQRIPAAEIIHEFILAEDEEQTRGVPWAHASLSRLHQLGRYNEAEVIAARIAACKGGFLKPPANDEDGGVPDDPDAAQVGEPHFDMEPGMFPILPTGWAVENFDPQHPNANYEAFERAMMRGVAAGLDLNYFTLTGDLKEVNYSTARVGLLDERDEWRGLQHWLIEHLHRRIYQAWLKAAMLGGALPISVADYERCKEALWQPRGWGWVDPEKEVNAHVTAIDNGLTTRTAIYAERGEDFEENIDQIAAEQAYLEQKGVKLPGGQKQSAPTKNDAGTS